MSTTSCRDLSWGKPPRDAQVSNVLVTDHATVCDLTAAKGGGGGGGGAPVIASPLTGSGTASSPVTLAEGDATMIPQYPLWTNGNQWTVDELQCLERESNVVTVCNTSNPIDLSILDPLVTVGSDGVVLCLAPSFDPSSAGVVVCDQTERVVLVQTADAVNSSLVLQSGDSGTTGDPGAGKIVLLGGHYAGTDSTKTSNISLAPSRSAGSGTVYIGSSVLDRCSHLGSSQFGTTTVALAPGADDAYAVFSTLCTDMAGRFTIDYNPTVGTTIQQPNTDIAVITFAKPYDPAPIVILRPMNADAWNAQCIVSSVTGTSFNVQHTAVKVGNDGPAGAANAYPPNGGTRWISLGGSSASTSIYPVSSPPSANSDTIDLAGFGGGRWFATYYYLVIQ